jgi:hypothetical protein
MFVVHRSDLTFTKLPASVIIHLDQFKASRPGLAFLPLGKTILCPELDFASFGNVESESSNYQLYVVCEFRPGTDGPGHSKGHYYVYVRLDVRRCRKYGKGTLEIVPVEEQFSEFKNSTSLSHKW